MTYKEFIAKYNGKGIDYDGAYGVQCFDLANQYCKEVVGCTGFTGLNAHQIYTDFDKQPNKAYFTRIANTPSFLPKAGDIMVWSGTLNGGIGHVAICNGAGDNTYFESYDQNWNGRNDPCTKIRHTYDHVLGVLRAKDQSKITGVKPLPVLDKRGCKLGDKNTGVLAIKCLLLLAYKLGMTSKVAKDAGFGAGTKNAVNSLLKKWGYKQNGVAGVNFIKRLHTEIEKKIK